MSDLCKRLEEAAIKSLPPDGHEYDFLGVEDTLEGEAIAEITRLRAQRDKLLVALRFYSDLENYRRLKLRPSYGKDAARLNTGPMSVEKDLGKIAREAIAEVKRERLSGEVK